MCGIYLSTKIYNQEIIKSKLERVSFRGPDASSHLILDSIIFGHNRLSIIDLDPRSNQPFIYDRLVVVFNGEIYNYKELRKDLQSRGYIFKTDSDTEVICAAYLEHGIECLNYFIGMFSFVIYDKQSKMLFGARDRLGKKPMYISLQNKTIEIGSQISQLKIDNKLTENQDAISKYLAWGHIPDPITIYNEVFKLRPGHYFIYDLVDYNFKEEKYWDINALSKNQLLSSYEDVKLELKTLLDDAVNLRLVSDVPLGIYLSGGIDSSLVASIASRNTNSSIKTFSIAFEEQEYNEAHYASKISKYLDSDHTEILCSIAEGLELVENIDYYFDEPFADSSAIPSLLLAKNTKNYVTVALSGDGGDEGFLGYERYNYFNIIKYLFSIPHSLRKPISNLIGLIPNYKFKILSRELANRNLIDTYISIMSFSDKWHNDLINARNVPFMELLSNMNLIESLSNFDIKTYLNNDINTKVDRSSMAFSLETRAPLMDHRIIEFSRMIPTEFKFEQGNGKKILKDILYDYLPKELFDRPKMGFGVPLKFWFRKELKFLVMDLLTEENIKQFPCLNYNEVKKSLNDHMEGKANNEVMIWRILMLIKWRQNS